MAMIIQTFGQPKELEAVFWTCPDESYKTLAPGLLMQCYWAPQILSPVDLYSIYLEINELYKAGELEQHKKLITTTLRGKQISILDHLLKKLVLSYRCKKTIL